MSALIFITNFPIDWNLFSIHKADDTNFQPLFKYNTDTVATYWILNFEFGKILKFVFNIFALVDFLNLKKFYLYVSLKIEIKNFKDKGFNEGKPTGRNHVLRIWNTLYQIPELRHARIDICALYSIHTRSRLNTLSTAYLTWFTS